MAQIFKHTFNARMLVPWEVVERYNAGDENAIADFIEFSQDEHRYKETDKVADISHIKQMMVVNRLRRKDSEPGGKEGRIIGIECYWWTD